MHSKDSAITLSLKKTDNEISVQYVFDFLQYEKC